MSFVIIVIRNSSSNYSVFFSFPTVAINIESILTTTTTTTTTLLLFYYIISIKQANLFAKYGEYIIAIKHSTAWGETPRRLKEAKLNVKRSFIFHLIIGLIVYLGYGTAVAQLTKTMDRRASLISVGFSRLFAGVMFCVLSINIPQFFGLYHSRNIKKNKVSCRKCVKEIRFAFGWSLWKLMSSVILYNGYFACRTQPQAVLYGILSE